MVQFKNQMPGKNYSLIDKFQSFGHFNLGLRHRRVFDEFSIWIHVAKLYYANKIT